MKELARKKFLEEDWNCAESVLLAANETYDLGIAPEDVAMVGGFGGGMGCGKTCGALCGAMAALGKARITTNAHGTEGFRQECGKLANGFAGHFGCVECAVIKSKHFAPDTKCATVVEKAAELLAEILGE